MTKAIRTFRTVLYSSIFYVEDIKAGSSEAAEARMRELWDHHGITADGCAEEITGIEAIELETPEPPARIPTMEPSEVTP